MKHNLNKEPKGRKKQKVNSTGFRGVEKSGEKFMANIKIDGKKSYLGTFDTKKAAARAYLRKKQKVSSTTGFRGNSVTAERGVRV